MGTNYIAPIWRMPRNANNVDNKLSNYSIAFNPSDPNYIEISDNILSGLENFSISVWYNTNTLSGDRAIVGSWSSVLPQMLLYWDDPDGWRFLMNDGTTSNDVIWGTATTTNEWHHIVVTFDGSTISFYHDNGTPVTDSGAGPIRTRSSAWRIGSDTSNSRYWDGELSQFCLFDYALSTDQVDDLYNLENPMIIDGGEPIQYLPLGDNSNPNAPGSFPNISTGTDSVFDFTPNQYMNIGDSNLFSFGDSVNDFPFSISGWFYFDATGSYGLVAKYGTTSTSREWMLYTTGSNFRLLLYDTNGQNAYADASDTTIVANKWYHVVATYNGAGNVPGAREGIQIYVNGQPETMTRAGGTGYVAMHNTGRRVDLGSRSNTSYFDGQMSNVQIWDVELSAPNALELYNNGQPLMTGTQPQEANLLAWYKLNQSANWEADTVGNWQIPDNRSAYPQSFDFDGSSDKIILPSTLSSLGISTEFTVSAWFNSSNLGIYDTIINAPTTATAWNSGFGFQIVNSKLRFWVNEWSTANYFTESSTLSANTWYHAVGTFSSTNGIRLYFEGELVDTATNNVLDGLTNTMTIGASITSYYFDGKISNVQIWNTELPATGSNSVETLYNNGVPLTAAIASDNLKAWYKLDNSSIWDGSKWVIDNGLANYETALDFVQSETDYIELDNVVNLGTTWTISFWINTTQGLTSNGTILAAGSGNGFTMLLLRNNQLMLYRGAGTDYNYFLSSTNFNDGGWHNVVLVRNGTSFIQAYLDGQTAPSSVTGSGNLDSKFSFIGDDGGTWSTATAFDGALSNIAFFDTALDASAVETIYNNGTPEISISSSPVSWWKLDNTTTGIQDSAGSNNGTNNGASEITTYVSTQSGISSGMTEQNLVNNNVSVLNGESVGMNTTNIVTSNLTRTQPYSNYSFNFDAASTDYFDLGSLQGTALQPSNTTLVSDGFSVSLWVNLDDTSTFRTFWQNDGLGNANYYGLIFLMNTGGQLNIGYNNGGAAGSGSRKNYITTAAQITSTGTWYHIVAIYKGIAVTPGLYVNGVEITAFNSPTGSATTLAYSSSAKGSIGIGRNAIQPMEGKISNCACFDRTLTQDEVLNIYNNGVPQDLQTASSFSNNIAAWWPMDGSNSYYDGTNWVVRDLENGKDGTGVNTGNVDDLVGNAPGSEANGTGTNLAIADLKGNMYNSDKNAYSINMADYADGVTNPANSGRSTEIPTVP